MNSDLSGTTTITTTRHKMPFLGRTLCRGPTKKCWQINHVPANNKLTEENRRHVVVVCLLSQLRLHGVNTCQRFPNLPSVTIFRTISRNQEVSYCRISGGGASNLSSLRRCSCQLVARRVESISQLVTLLVAVC